MHELVEEMNAEFNSLLESIDIVNTRYNTAIDAMNVDKWQTPVGKITRTLVGKFLENGMNVSEKFLEIVKRWDVSYQQYQQEFGSRDDLKLGWKQMLQNLAYRKVGDSSGIPLWLRLAELQVTVNWENLKNRFKEINDYTHEIEMEYLDKYQTDNDDNTHNRDDFEDGDKVEVNHEGEWVPATFRGPVQFDNLVFVEYDYTPGEFEPTMEHTVRSTLPGGFKRGDRVYSLFEATEKPRFGTLGGVVGPATSGDERRLAVVFKGRHGEPSALWNVLPTELNRTKPEAK